MLVVQTAAEPPNQGRMYLLTMSCTWNNKSALRNNVEPNTTAKVRIGTRFGSAVYCSNAVEDTAFLIDRPPYKNNPGRKIA